MIGKILYFVVFVAMYCGWLVAATWVLEVARRSRGAEPGVRYALAATQAGLVLGMIWAITRQCDLDAFVTIVAVTVVSAIAADHMIRLRSTPEVHHAQMNWMGQAMALQCPKMMGFLIIVAALLVLAFPIVVGTLYFLADVPSPDFTRTAVHVVLLMIFGASLTTSAWVFAKGLAWDTLDDRVRDTLFGILLVQLVPQSLWLAILLRIAADGASERLLALGLVLGYLVLVLVGPYLIGRRRSRDLRMELLETRRDNIVALQRTLATPMSTEERVDAIQGHATSLEEEAHAQVDGNSDVELAVAIMTKDRDWALNVLTHDDDPYVHFGGRRHLKPRYLQLEDHLSQLAASLGHVQPSLIRVDHLGEIIEDVERTRQMLSELGAPALATNDDGPLPALPAGDSGGDERDHRPTPTIDELCELPLHSSEHEATDGSLLVAGLDPIDLEQRWANRLALEVADIDRRVLQVQGARTGAAVKFVGSALVGFLIDQLGAQVTDMASGSFPA